MPPFSAQPFTVHKTLHYLHYIHYIQASFAIFYVVTIRDSIVNCKLLKLLSLLEKWKSTLDKKGFAVAVLMDLSKVFYTINNELLIAKLNAYDFSEPSLKLI